MSESFELRQLVAEKTRRRPMTDFYEYYWAHQMKGTRFGDVLSWMRDILLRAPWRIPPRLRVLWSISWLLAVVALVLFFEARSLESRTPPWLWSVVVVLFGSVQVFAATTVGDAARYLSPIPNNIAIRQRIRSEGVELLRKLHESGRYDRVILVGHSLGSVIGYDMLTHYWPQCHMRYTKVDRPRQRALEASERIGAQLEQAALDARRSPRREPTRSAQALSALREQYRTAQREQWLEARSLGFPWLVTDFVTLGSPLAHAALLLAKDQAELEARQSQRELPTAPPSRDGNRYSFVVRYQLGEQARSIRVLHHAAQFVSTRWTNVFFPLRLGILGDFVGGPIAPVFGEGVLDIPVTDGAVRLLPLVPHTHYWKGVARSEKATSALSALREALDLNSAGWLPRFPETESPSTTPNGSEETEPVSQA